MADLKGAADMNVIDQVPVLLFHFVEGLVSKNTRIVNHYVNLSERIHRGLDDLVAIGDRVIVSDSFAATRFDFVHDDVCRGLISAITKSRTTKIIDDNFSASLTHFKCVGSAKAITGSGNYDHSVIKSDICHLAILSFIKTGLLKLV